MLPRVDALFTLVQKLASRTVVTEVAVPKWLVQRHGLAALAARAGDTSYREDLALATLEWARIAGELPDVIRGLTGRGVRVAPIKGAAYAKALYAHPADRPMRDIDLLVPPEHVQSARRVLSDVGFAPAPGAVMHHATPFVRGQLAIDLHWNIIAPGRSRIDLSSIWARMRPGWPDGAERMDAVDALVFHWIHLARNRLRLPLVNVVDAARLLEQASATDALQRARGWGLGTAAHIAMSFCSSILGDKTGRPVGWLGPSREEIVEIADQSIASKFIFDVAIAGSPRQLASRIVHFGANRLRALMRRG